ncbi:MAG: hypothetical protein ACX931_03885 [Saccharospirillum sp.]
MTDFTRVYQALRAIMLPYAEQLDCKTDSATELYVDTRHVMTNGKPLWFGGVQIKKRYVSYHLMPVYVNPQLLVTLSPKLKKRMQGKSCFNFTSVDEALFQELAALTEAGFRDYAQQGLLGS